MKRLRRDDLIGEVLHVLLRSRNSRPFCRKKSPALGRRTPLRNSGSRPRAFRRVRRRASSAWSGVLPSITITKQVGVLRKGVVQRASAACARAGRRLISLSTSVSMLIWLAV